MLDPTKKYYIPTLIGSGIGFTAGAYFAYKKGKKFWGYVGFMLIGSLVGSALTAPITVYLKNKEDKNNSLTVQ